MIKIFWCNNSNLSNELEAKVLKRIESSNPDKSSDQDFILKQLSDDEDFSRELELKNSQNSIGILVLWINLDNIRLVKDIVKKFNDVLRKKTMLDFIGFVVVFDDTQLHSEIKETLYSEIKELLLQKKRIFVTPFNPSVFIESIKALAEEIQYKAEEIQYKQELERLKSQLEKARNRDQIVDVTCAILKDHPLVGYDRMTISLVDRSTNSLDRYLLHFRSDEPPKGQPIRSLVKGIKDDTLIKNVAKNTVLVIENIPILREKDPDKLKEMGWETNKPTTEDIKSWIGLAAKYQNETVAIITLDRVAGDKRYNDNNRKLQDFLKDFGEIFAAHIETYFLKRNKEIIQGITKHMGEKLTTKDLINNILLKLQEGLKTDNFNYFSVAYNCDEKKRYLQELTSVNNSSNQEQSKKPCAYIEGIGIAGLVLQDGKSRIIPNAAEDDGFVASFKHRGEKLSLLAIAVKPNPNSNRIIGVISCYKQETDYFTVYDRHLLEQVTNVTATLIERTITLENLNEISQKMSELVLIRNKTELLKTICQKALEMTSAGSASIHLLDYDKENSQNEDCYKGYTVNKTTPPYTSPENSEKSPRLNRKGVTDYIIDHVGDKIDSFIFDKNHELDRVSQDDQNPKIVSKLVVPLKIIENKQQRLIGALYLNKYSDENFSDVELFALELLGKQAASVIKDQRILWKKTFIANARQKLTEAIKTVANHTELDLLLKDIARYAYELIQINEFPSKESAQEEFFCFVDMLKTDRKPEVTVAWPEYHLTQLRGKRNECNNKQENKKGIIGLVIDKKETIVISDIQDKNGEDYKKYGDDYIEYSPKTHSELVVPITVEEKIEGKNEKKVIGVINLEHSQPNKFIKLHREVIEHFASQVAIAYQKEKLAETINKSNKVLTRLHQSLPRIMSEPVENLLYEAVSSARNALSVEEFIVLLFSDSKPDWEKMVPSSTLFKNPKNDLKKISIISINVYGGKNDKPIENTLKFGDPPVHDGLCLLFADGPNKRGVVWIIFPNNIDQNLIKENEEIYKVYVSQIALAYGNAKRFEKFNNQDKDDLSEEIKTDLKRARQESVLWFLISIISSVLGIVFIGYGVCFWLIASGFILGQDNQPQVQSNENQNPVAKQGKAKAETPPAESQTANLSIILGLIIQAVPILAFKQATEANKRLENYHQERINIGKLSLLLAATRQLSFDYPDEQKSDAHDGAKKIIELAANSWLQVANFDKDKDTGKTNVLESLTKNLPSLTKETKDSSENNQPSNK